MTHITPCRWFDGKAEEAGEFYVSLFPDSRVDTVDRAPSDYPSGKAGDVLMVEFTLMVRPFTGLNGGRQFRVDEAISFHIPWRPRPRSIASPTRSRRCARLDAGCVKDRFGLPWQIFPRQLIRLISDADPPAHDAPSPRTGK